MDIVSVAQEIENTIKILRKGRSLLPGRAKNKAEATAMYDKAIAKTLIQLKNGVKFTLDDQVIENPPASYCEKIARGLCWNERIALDLAESEYKNAIEGLRCIEAELNGWQSYNRYLQDKA